MCLLWISCDPEESNTVTLLGLNSATESSLKNTRQCAERTLQGASHPRTLWENSDRGCLYRLLNGVSMSHQASSVDNDIKLQCRVLHYHHHLQHHPQILRQWCEFLTSLPVEGVPSDKFVWYWWGKGCNEAAQIGNSQNGTDSQ